MNIFGVAGWKNTGKTGLVTRLVTHFTEAGMRVSTIKHAHHAFDVDHEGRDSWRHREAGAAEVLVASRHRVALMEELRDAPEPSLDDLLSRLKPADLILIEGYKSASHPKIETYRAEAGKALIAPGDPTIKAIASDVPFADATIPVLDLNDTHAIGDFIVAELGLK